MKSTLRLLSALKAVLPAAALLLMATASHAQTVAQITRPIRNSELSPLKGNVHPLVKSALDTGVAPSSAPTGSLILTLKRSDAQEASLQQFLANVHTKGNASYHHWLTPAQFGQKFGISDSDLAQVKSWLQSQGFTIQRVGAGRTAIEFSGTTGQVATAFHTSLHTYVVNGETHHANATDPQIPAALAPVIAGVSRLNDFHPQSQMKLLGRAHFDSTTRRVTPEWTTPTDSGSTAYAIGPADFATQYDLTPLYQAGVNGSGQTIGILNESNINLNLVQSYRALFNLDPDPIKPNLPHVIVDGNDPGVTSAETEAYLDVEMAGSVAPQATVNLYIAANTDYNDGLDLAILRAVEDDVATVLSLSFGSCEAEAGPSYLAYINSVWEQAAAQGQTVMVSSGDNSSAGCDNQDLSIPAQQGPQVNGLASTPWNIAVGGTDFYYSDYATGGASITQDWSSTNGANLGSLLHTLPEQPWNNTSYGLNIVPTPNYVPSILGGSGGQSTCAVVNGPLLNQNPLTAYGLCEGLGGYSKPAWQAGPGVPADGVRDIPDVSLFAAYAANDSFYAICAIAGDCTATDPTANVLYYTSVGGTSASAPAFAGIMALVNQKYGAQGQANTVLYPLAAQMPSIFHDVTVGSNNVPCASGSPGCEQIPGTTTYALQKWPATPGYDLASGLGSVDANALVANWNSVKLAATNLTFTASQTNFVHGTAVNLTATVIPGSGTAVPTGAVAVTADTTLPANKGQIGITLDSQGSGAASVNFLPGGTYNLQADYSGDTTFSSSKSAPITVTVSPESSLLLTGAFEYATSPYSPQYPLSSPVPFGTIAGFDVQVSNGSGQVDGVATGSITVQDNGATIATVPLNANGAAVYASSAWTTGNHSLTFSYSGDPSYTATTTTNPQGPVTFAVGKGTPAITLIANGSSLPVGGTFIVQMSVAGNGGVGGLSPTGTVTATLGTLTQNVTLAPTSAGESVATATFTNLPAGNYPLSVAYTGDSNWSGTSVTGNPLSVTASTLLPATVTVTSNPVDLSTITPGTLITLTATVQGSGAAPTGSVFFVTDGIVFSSNDNSAITLVASGTGTSTASINIIAGNASSGSNQVYVLYFGDANYSTSSSSVLMFNNNQGDFAIQNLNPTLILASGASGSASLTLSASNQFSGAVTLSCIVTGNGTALPLCTVPASVTLASTGQVAVTAKFTTTLPNTSARGNLPQSPGWLMRGGATTLACLFFFAIPARRRRPGGLFTLLLAIFLVGSIAGCSGGGTASAPPTGPTSTMVPAGAYQAVITATNGVVTHNIAVNLNVTSTSAQ